MGRPTSRIQLLIANEGFFFTIASLYKRMLIPLTKSLIRQSVGPSFYSRGLAYFQEGRVKEVSVDEERGLIIGTVRGGSLYFVDIEVDVKTGVITEDTCTCPMGGGCKHVAALYIAAIAEQEQKHAEHGMLSSSFTEEPSWKKAFTNLAPTVSAATETRKPHVDIVIAFRLHEVPRYYVHDGDFTLEIKARYCILNDGKKSYVDIPWHDARRSDGWTLKSVEVSSIQMSFLKRITLAVLSESVYSPTSGAWYQLGKGNVELVLEQLRNAKESGVRLVNGTKNAAEITFSDVAATPAYIIRDKDDGVTVKSSFIYDGVELPDPLFVVGEPPMLAAIMRIDPTQKRDTVVIAALFGIHETRKTFSAPFIPETFIPGKDIPVFVSDVLLKLAPSTQMLSFSERLTLPKYVAPELLLDISRGSMTGIKITLHWQYGNETFLPLHSDLPMGTDFAARDRHTEIAILSEFVTTLGTSAEDFLSDNSDTHNSGRPTSKDAHVRFSFDGDPARMRHTVILERFKAAHFLKEFIPPLREKDGFVIHITPDVPEFTEEFATPEVTFTVDEIARENGTKATTEEFGHDWFNLGMSITVAGLSLPFKEVFRALAEDEEFLFLPNGRYVSLKQEIFDRLRRLLEEARHLTTQEGEGLRMSRYQAGWWEELAKLGIVAKQANAWKESVSMLIDRGAVVRLDPPSGLIATLRPYQAEGFAWLSFLRDGRLGGILADDMGLGKTVQAIAFICHVEEEHARAVAASKKRKTKKDSLTTPRFLIVAPTSVVENWDTELARFAPHLKRVIFRAGDRSEHHKALCDTTVAVTSYALLHRDEKEFGTIMWDTIIFDEAQVAKNHQSKIYSVARKLSAYSKLALSGTPLENNLMEFWSLFSLVAPGLFPSVERFRELYQRPIEKGSNKSALDNLRRTVRPFLLRRTKDLVAKDLPAKTQSVVLLELDPKQRKIYETHLTRERQRVLGLLAEGGMQKNRFAILTGLMRLRQLCLHSVLVDEKHKGVPSAKLDALIEQLEAIVGEGHRVLVFSQFTSFLALAKERLERAEISYSYLDGATKKRKDAITAFTKEDGASVFLISLKAGGFGLNLTQADYCIMLDPWWNPAVEAQAIDRAHRIGQTKPVMVYKFIAKDTIEEKVLVLQEKKRKLFTSVMDDDAVFSALVTEEDIKALFR